MRIDWQKYIEVDFDVYHGGAVPFLIGKRIPVSMIGGCVADGMTSD